MCFDRRKPPKHLIIKDDYHSDKNFGFGWILAAVVILLAGMFISIAVNAQGPTQLVMSGSP